MRIYINSLFFILSISFAATANDNPYNYFSINFGAGNFQKPLIYIYSLEYSRDLNISEKSSFSLGAEFEKFTQYEKFKTDTNYIGGFNQTGFYTLKYYDQKKKVVFLNLGLAYKYWLKKNKTSSIYLQTELNLNFVIKETTNATYYYRDANQVLHSGPFSLTYKEKSSNGWFIDNIRPALTFGYLKNINQNLGVHIKVDMIFSSPHQTPSGQAYLYPKLGVGLAFR